MTRRFWLAAAAVLGLALLLRGVLLSADVFPFNADEAVVGLMARHILAGRWPTFFYGQAYLGSLDAVLVAGAFRLIGESIAAIRIVQTALYLGTILTTMLLVRQMDFGVLVSGLAGVLIAIPSVNATLYTTVSLGGYGEALLLGNLILMASLRLARGGSWRGYLLWGALAGLSLWVFGITLIYSIPAAVLLLIVEARRMPAKDLLRLGAATLGGAALGLLPMLAWAAGHGVRPLVDELLGSAIAGASPSDLPRAVGAHLANLALFAPTVALGLRPPWAITSLGMPVAPVAALLWLAFVGLGLRRASWPEAARFGRSLLLGTALTLAVGFLLTPFGADPSGRYFVPLAVPLAVFAAVGIEAAQARTGRPWPLALAAILVGFNLWTHVQVSRQPEGFTTQFDSSTVYDHSRDPELVEFLIERNAVAGYTTYWVAYPLAFLSQERLVYLPHLPYHSDFRYAPRDDRYEPYRAVVAAEPRPAYITARQPWLDEVLRRRLGELGVDFEETVIGDYRVFHDLSATVRPEDLGLGPQATP